MADDKDDSEVIIGYIDFRDIMYGLRLSSEDIYDDIALEFDHNMSKCTMEEYMEKIVNRDINENTEIYDVSNSKTSSLLDKNKCSIVLYNLFDNAKNPDELASNINIILAKAVIDNDYKYYGNSPTDSDKFRVFKVIERFPLIRHVSAGTAKLNIFSSNDSGIVFNIYHSGFRGNKFNITNYINNANEYNSDIYVLIIHMRYNDTTTLDDYKVNITKNNNNFYYGDTSSDVLSNELDLTNKMNVEFVNMHGNPIYESVPKVILYGNKVEINDFDGGYWNRTYNMHNDIKPEEIKEYLYKHDKTYERMEYEYIEEDSYRILQRDSYKIIAYFPGMKIDFIKKKKKIKINLKDFYRTIDNYSHIEHLPKDVQDKIYSDKDDIEAESDASNAFNNMSKLRDIKFNFDTKNVTNMDGMFRYCYFLTSLDVSHFDTKNVANMYGMFKYCSSLKSLDVSHFDTKNVTDMRDMFSACKSLKSLDVSHFDTKNVTDMRDMFYDCKSLTSIDLSNWDTKNVTDMRGMFYDCNSLTSLDVSHWNTKSVTNMNDMFNYCESLTSIDLSNFDTKNVIDMNDMFNYCESLTSIDLSNFDTKNVIDMNDMFSGCRSLKFLDVSHFDTRNVEDMNSMFSSCASLKYIILLDLSKNIKLLDLINTEYKTNIIKVLTSTDSYNTYKNTYNFLEDVNNYSIYRHNGMVDISKK